MARRTNEQVEQAITAAVHEELTERGYLGVTFEGVARRAQTSKPVLYRRYSSRAEMVLRTLGHSLWDEFPIGLSEETLRNGIIVLLRFALDRFGILGSDNLRALIGEADQPILEIFSGAMELAERVLAEQIIAPAVARGSLGPVPIPSGVLRVPFAVLREQLLFRTDQEMTLDEITDNICLPLFKAVSKPLVE